MSVSGCSWWVMIWQSPSVSPLISICGTHSDVKGIVRFESKRDMKVDTRAKGSEKQIDDNIRSRVDIWRVAGSRWVGGTFGVMNCKFIPSTQPENRSKKDPLPSFRSFRSSPENCTTSPVCALYPPRFLALPLVGGWITGLAAKYECDTYSAHS